MHARAKVRRSARLDKMQRGDKERLGCWDRDRRGHYRTRDEGIKKLPVKQPACRHDGIWRERGKEQPWGTQEQTVSSEPYRSPNVPHAAIKHSKSCLECAAVQCWSTIALGGRLVTPGVPSPRPPTPRVQLQRVLYKTTHCHRNAARSSRPRCGPHGNTCGRVHMLVFPVFFFLSIFFFFFFPHLPPAMPVWAPAVACMRTAVSHSPTQGTRLDSCYPLACHSPPCASHLNLPGYIHSFTGRAPSRWACSRFLVCPPGLVFGRSPPEPRAPCCLSLHICFLTPQSQVVIVLAVRPPTATSSPLRNHPKGGYLHESTIGRSCMSLCARAVRPLVCFVGLLPGPRLTAAFHFFCFSSPLLLQHPLSPRSLRRPLARASLPRYEMRDTRPACFLQCSAASYNNRSFRSCAAKS
ncbi:hypothetical protein IWX91DRAFT_207653 [Phyllosticta citricarpa]